MMLNAVERLRASYTFTGFGSVCANQSVQVLAGTNVFAAASYTYSGYEHITTSRTRVAIDPNVRVRGNGTYAGFEDLDGPVSVGEEVEVYEAESGLTGTGRVTEIDGGRELVYLSVDWSDMTCEDAASADFPTPAAQALYLPSTSTMDLLSTSVLGAQSESEWLRLAATPSLAFLDWCEDAFFVTAPVFVATSDLPSPFTTHIEIWQSNNFLEVAA
jgi:hypothetical protein